MAPARVGSAGPCLQSARLGRVGASFHYCWTWLCLEEFGPCLGGGNTRRVGMATGLGEGEGGSVPGLAGAHSSLSPWSPLGGRGRWGPLEEVSLNASSALWLTFPHRTFEWYGLQQPAALFSACQLPGYPGEGQAGRWALGARRPLSPSASLGLSPSRLLPQLPRKALSLGRWRNGGKAFSKVREITGQGARMEGQPRLRSSVWWAPG